MDVKAYEAYRGACDLVIAELTESVDTAGLITETYGEVETLSGVQGITHDVNESAATFYYNDGARIVVTSEGEDSIGLVVSVTAMPTRAKIEGRTYDTIKKAYVATPQKKKYFALGYKVGKTTGGTEKQEYYWFYKGTFTKGSTSFNTKDDGTEVGNMEYTYTAIYPATKYQLTDGMQTAKYAVIESDHPKASTFFETVTTPDKILTA